MAISAALALSDFSQTTLLAPTIAPKERNFALGLRAMRFLQRLNVNFEATAVRRFLLFAGKRSLTIDAEEVGLPYLCHIVCEKKLLSALYSRLENVCLADFSLPCHYLANANGVELTLEDGHCFSTQLLVAADGAKSTVARCAGVGAAVYPFRQLALCATLSAPMDSQTAAQWFGDNNTLALLPIGGGLFSLIWSLPVQEAQSLIKQGNLAAAVAKHTGWRIQATDDKITSFPLTAIRRASRCAPGLAFLGDAARVIHPLAGQGLNMGFADCEWLAACVQKHQEPVAALGDYANGREIKTEFLHQLTTAFANGSQTAIAMCFGRFKFARRLLALGANL